MFIIVFPVGSDFSLTTNVPHIQFKAILRLYNEEEKLAQSTLVSAVSIFESKVLKDSFCNFYVSFPTSFQYVAKLVILTSDLMLNPCVGIILLISSCDMAFKMVVLPALSRPRTRMRASPYFFFKTRN